MPRSLTVALNLGQVVLLVALGLLPSRSAWAQILAAPPVADKAGPLENPSRVSIAKEQSLIEEVYEPELLLRLEPSQSKIIKVKAPVDRVVITDPDVLDMQLFDNDEIQLIGKQAGETTITFWFDGPDGKKQILRYYVEVDNAEQEQRRREARYQALQSRINEAFPNSQVFLSVIDDKVIVRGQARDAQEATDIMRMLGDDNAFGRRAFDFDRGRPRYGNGNVNDSFDDYGFDNLDADIFINLLQVPGAQQVMLKVRVAELVRDSNRAMGLDLAAFLRTLATASTTLGRASPPVFSNRDVEFFLGAIASHGYGKILAEPTLVTISGKSAKFLAGGEFAVPTTIGSGAFAATNTTFRGFGTELEFTPTVLDKDRIRLEVRPSVSTLNADAAVSGIPGLNLSVVDTTVDLREGQWLAIAGLIQEEQGGTRAKVPLLGDLPVLRYVFSKQRATRGETELIVLVGPELVHPLETEQVPLFLPGMEVTDPTNVDFFCRGLIEGYEGFHHRSTVWPEVAQQMHGVQHAEHHLGISHGIKRALSLHETYISGPCGLSK